MVKYNVNFDDLWDSCLSMLVGIILIGLTEVSRPAQCGWHHSRSSDARLYRKANGSWAPGFIHLCFFSRDAMQSSASSSHCCDFPTTGDLNLILCTFSLQVPLSDRCISWTGKVARTLSMETMFISDGWMLACMRGYVDGREI